MEYARKVEYKPPGCNMKSVTSAAIVASILLTGEWASDLLARNGFVITMILAAAGVWARIAYKTSKPVNMDDHANKHDL